MQPLDTFYVMVEDRTQAYIDEAEAQQRLAYIWALIALGAMVLLVALSLIFVYRRLGGALSQAREVARRLAQGDLSVDIQVKTQDEGGDLLRAMDGMRLKLIEIIGDVRSSALSVGTASGQIASGSSDLSQRSATAAEEIKALITDSVGKVKNGSQLVEKSGDTLQGIVGNVQRITELVSEIAAASNEQASGVEQINHAMMQMDEVTQQNASLVEQTAAASQSMKEQAARLQERVAYFRFGSGSELVKV